MKRCIVLPLVLLLSAVVLTGAAFASSSAENSASGTLTLNGTKIKLAYATVDLLDPDEPIVVVSDTPLVTDDFSIGLLSESFIRERNVHALLLGISRKDRRLSKSLNFLYFPGESTHFVNYGDQVALTITRMNDTEIEGRAVTPKPVVEEFSEVTFSLDVRFKVSLVMPQVSKTPTEVSVTGDASPPVMAYAEYYLACVEGDSEKVRRLLSTEARKQFDTLDKQAQNVFLKACGMRPSHLSARTPTADGKAASFTVAGSTPAGDKATGSVRMLLEEGKWKVLEDKWEFLSK